MQNRIKLIEFFRDQGFKNAAEIGVFDGRFSEVICQTIPSIKLLCIDSWEKGTIFPKYKIAVEKLAPYNTTVIRGASVEEAKNIEDESLDFVFIDAEHSYNSVREDITAWAPKVKIGGAVSFHDYYLTRTGNTGVIRAVDEYVFEHGYKLQLTDRDPKNPVKDDRQQSAWFIKDH